MTRNVILILAAAILLVFAGVAGYAAALMIRRPPSALYQARTRQSDFVPLSQIPDRQIVLFLETEDSVFYTHCGFDIEDIRDAVRMNFSARRIVYGGSTITQQLAKNLYFRFTHSYLRKAAELLITLTMERMLRKDRILEFYLNIIYFGNGVYGISDAAHFYFGKHVSELSLNQMLILACIPAVPTRGNPIQHPEVFERVRNRHLRRLIKGKKPIIAPEDAAVIFASDANCLDPELRKPDDFTQNYPQTIPLINERFGPFAQVEQTSHRG